MGVDEEVDMVLGFGYGEHGDGYPFDSANGLLAHAWAAGPNDIDGDAHFDDAEFWTLGRGRVTETYFGNSDGAPCVFPFTYENVEYTTCTSAGRRDGKEWCSTTKDFDRDQLFGFCSSEKLFTYGGSGDASPCVFPFVFLEKSYDACTKEGRSDGYRWCATTSSYDADHRWGFCPDRVTSTEGGNSEGAPCTFPFVFQGESYNDCTIVGRNDGLSWCATTEDFDAHGKFGFCKNSGYSLLLVAAHEFGHSLGLDHSRQQSALMYPTYSFVDNFNKLPQDDINGAQSLYGRRTSILPALVLEKCGGGSEEGGGGTRTTERPRTTETPPVIGGSNDVCDLRSVDAVMLIATELFVFKGYNFWRVRRDLRRRSGPFRISDQWVGGPEEVDSAYVRPQDQTVVLFKGRRYWEFQGNNLKPGFPKPLTDIGLPANVPRVDAALNWWRSKDRKRSYFFVGEEYYRYSELNPGIPKRYPKPANVWHRTFRRISAAVADPDRKRTSLFFIDDQVIKLNNYKFTIEKQFALDVFLNCRSDNSDNTRPAPLVQATPFKREP